MYGELYGETLKINNYNDYKNVPHIEFFEKEEQYGDISKLTINNDDFRRVLDTSENHQIVLMSLLPKEEIGEEIHSDTDQFFRIEQGNGVAILNGKKIKLHDGMFVNVPFGTRHNIINTGRNRLKLYTIYSPPHHRKGLVEPDKPLN